MLIVVLAVLGWVAFDALFVCAVILAHRLHERRIRVLASDLVRAAEGHANGWGGGALPVGSHAAAGADPRRLG